VYTYSVRNLYIYLPGKNLAISAQRLPICLCSWYIIRSSVSVHADFLISGLRWLCHLQVITKHL